MDSRPIPHIPPYSGMPGVASRDGVLPVFLFRIINLTAYVSNYFLEGVLVDAYLPT